MYTYFEITLRGWENIFFCSKKNGNQNMQSIAISNMMMFSHTKSMNNSKFKELPVWRVCSCGLICYKVEQAIFVCLFFTRYSRRLTLHLYYIILAALSLLLSLLFTTPLSALLHTTTHIIRGMNNSITFHRGMNE